MLLLSLFQYLQFPTSGTKSLPFFVCAKASVRLGCHLHFLYDSFTHIGDIDTAMRIKCLWCHYSIQRNELSGTSELILKISHPETTLER